LLHSVGQWPCWTHQCQRWTCLYSCVKHRRVNKMEWFD